jgi:exopolyphosphatase/guanosine-5'-triphosphate,3'-diphosphate pyrophosphatase
MKSATQRIAAIDIGTNSVLLLVAEFAPSAPHELRPVLERATITRLGQDVDKTTKLHPEAVKRTLDCLCAYAKDLREQQVVALDVVGTSASRDAQGAEAFLVEATAILGVKSRVISGEEEALLTFSGALSGLKVSGAVAVHDIGGGSTEIVQGEVTEGVTEPKTSISLNIGSVRLTERHIHSDPPSEQDLEKVREDVREALKAVSLEPKKRTWVGIAGTVTTIAAVAKAISPYDGARVHGSELEAQEIGRTLEQMAKVPLEERRRLIGMEPKRADVIVAGATICDEIMKWAKAERIVVSDRGVRWGLALKLAKNLAKISN